MKFDKTAVFVNLALLALIGTYGIASAGVTGLGIAAMLTGILNIPLAIIAAIAGKKATANTAWIFLALWLLIGFSICSSTGLGNFH